MGSSVDLLELSRYIQEHGGHTTLWVFDKDRPEHGKTLLQKLIEEENVYLLESYSYFLATSIQEKVVSSDDIEVVENSRVKHIRTTIADELRTANEKVGDPDVRRRGGPQLLPENVGALNVSALKKEFMSLDQPDEFRRAYDMYFRSRGVPKNLDMVSTVKYLIDKWNSGPSKVDGAWLLERLAVYSAHPQNETIGNKGHLRKQYTEIAFHALFKRCGVALVWALLSLPSGRRPDGTTGSQQMPKIITGYLEEYEDALRTTHEKLHLDVDTYELLSTAGRNPLDLSEADCNENSTVRFVILDQLVKQGDQKGQEPHMFYQSIVHHALSKLHYTDYASHALWLAFTVSEWALAGARDKDELYRAVTLCQAESRARESLKLLRDVLQLLEQSFPGKAIAYEPLRLYPVPPEYFAWCEVDEQTSWAEAGSRLSSLYDEVRISFRRLVRAR
ncbi:hypothetical protein BJX66DRAFT_345507 [Aspergillus keveii]|uniref:Uncharacterized protein n=1 Tax=Aspergillus keveii TaxID=714993 RepID=A0ABR4FI77_9EURO